MAYIRILWGRVATTNHEICVFLEYQMFVPISPRYRREYGGKPPWSIATSHISLCNWIRLHPFTSIYIHLPYVFINLPYSSFFKSFTIYCTCFTFQLQSSNIGGPWGRVCAISEIMAKHTSCAELEVSTERTW